MEKFAKLFKDFENISLDASHGELVLIIDFTGCFTRLREDANTRFVDGDGFEIMWTSDGVLEMFVYELSSLDVAVKLLFAKYIK